MGNLKEVVIPDMGNVGEAEVIEISVAPGDKVNAEDTLIVLESEKASMDIPTPYAGTVKQMKVKVGDKVSAGSVIASVQTEGLEAEPAKKETTAMVEKKEPEKAAGESAAVKATQASAVANRPALRVVQAEVVEDIGETSVHAGPGVRRFARDLGVDLTQVRGTGPKDRILKEDVQAFVKNVLTQGPVGVSSGSGLPAAPVVDFAQFGETEVQPLTRIKKLTGANLSRNWLLAPHVTQFDEADITELEAFRKGQLAAAEKQGVKLTPLVFLMKAIVASLKAFPRFNASLDAKGENLILKKYFHLGVAVDTPEGLVVPVIRDVDQKGMFDLAKELAEISAKARNKELTAKDMQGSCFTISSLGGVGGTFFTPIINLPDVAILGVSKSVIKPVYQEGQFVPRLMLPLALSYDHRVIDGAEGARFIVHLTSLLGDIRRLLL